MFERLNYDPIDLPLVPLYQAVLSAGIGGLESGITYLDSDSSSWARIVREARNRPELEALLLGVRIIDHEGIGPVSEQIESYLWGLSLSEKLILNITNGGYLINPKTRSELYDRNIARLRGREPQIQILSEELTKLAIPQR